MRKELSLFRIATISIALICLGAESSSAQARRVAPATARPTPEASVAPGLSKSVKEMFDEANAYNRVKFAEYEQKKVPPSDALIAQTQRERKQLAAKYAAAIQPRSAELSADELFYLGLLHWIAENLDRTREALGAFLAKPAAETAPDKLQDARAIVAVIHARQKNFADAERTIAEYVKGSPVKLSQRGQMERELARSYRAEGQLAPAAIHALESFRAYKAVAADPAARDKVIDEVAASGLFLFETYRALDSRPQADAALAELRNAAVELQSPDVFYWAVDAQVRYQIETGRKPAALQMLSETQSQISRDFSSKQAQTVLAEKFKKRERQYRMLGETAPELVNIDRYFPGERTTLAALRGKVVLLDFWATWCAPCIEAFPAIHEWQQDFGKDGFVVLGLTRYYGQAEGFPVDHANEVEFLDRFRRRYAISYDFLVAKDDANHKTYGALAIPTAAIIDRKGNIRYLETGTSTSRLNEMREMIEKLIREK
ncbi:MAG: TlpA family protein disulfide reductase [Pyrinomonadaceae bacterium]